ncbi:hypothetical protein Kpho01_71760 [Kitasatospora phosalacinea]|uniref:Lipoprotein n=1 Tax=Kitasatospora phosalacinea TaxID=2065 RepID=A0A9W6PQ88_9ACTN|nr:hypothetical protein Kpho01_71760 [Kitasatospora phosalacinea]
MVTERRIPGHARSGLKHWALVAAGCAAVVGGALGATSATGAVTGGQRAADGPVAEPVPTASPLPEADLAKVRLPLECGPFPVAVSLKASAVLDGEPVTVAAAHCRADMGTPPDGVFLVGADGAPVLLLPDADGLTVTELAVRSDGSIRGKARGYSSPDVPRFSPDLQVELVWTRSGGAWAKTETRTPVQSA